MGERIAKTIVLVEDREQQNLVRRYMERCGHEVRRTRFELAGNEKDVRNRYAKEVRACRSSVGRRVSCLLVVMIDADMRTTEFRRGQLAHELSDAGMAPRGDDEPIVHLIPKRHVETWIHALLGERVDEATDYAKAPYKAPTPADVSKAALELHRWTRPRAVPGETSPPSLTDSIAEWRRIP